jgi:hypothetical protein
MGLLADVEHKLERLVDGCFARLFGGRLTIGVVVRAVEEAVERVPSQSGPQVANDYRVRLHPVDWRQLEPRLADAERAAAEAVARVATGRGWGRPRGVVVRLEADGETVRGQVAVTPAFVPRPPTAELAPAAGGRAVVLTERTMMVGRDPGCDVHLPLEAVSRQHAQIARLGEAWVVTDLKSSNGTLVNGARIVSAPLRDGDRVAFGPAVYVFREH